MLKPAYISKLILLASILAFSSTLYAQKVDTYQIELLIIKHTDYQAGALEQVINPALEHRLKQPALNIHKKVASKNIKLITNPQRFKLTDHIKKFKNSDLFEVLLHTVWEQPPYYRTDAKYIDILEEPTKGLLKGLAWISYEEYFQVRLDFQYDTSFGDKPKALDIANSKDSVVSVHIKKIMTDGTLYYLDHPTISVLAYITAVDENMDINATAPSDSDETISTSTTINNP